jgi:hypothetical protein
MPQVKLLLVHVVQPLLALPACSKAALQHAPGCWELSAPTTMLQNIDTHFSKHSQTTMFKTMLHNMLKHSQHTRFSTHKQNDYWCTKAGELFAAASCAVRLMSPFKLALKLGFA